MDVSNVVKLSGKDLAGLRGAVSGNEDTVQIPKREYEGLLEALAELNLLKTSLAVNEEVLDEDKEEVIQTPELSVASSAVPSPRRKRASAASSTKDQDEKPMGNEKPGNVADNVAEGVGAPFPLKAKGPGLTILPHYDPNAKCTVAIKSSNTMTHADVAAVVRGGIVVQIFLRPGTNTAQVTFLDSEQAKAFLKYAQSIPFYVAGCLVTVRWSNSSWVAPGYVRRQAFEGATRNLFINNVQSHITEAVIRENLLHIEGLAVLHVLFSGGTAYVSTNSIKYALVARTCLTSRAMYKHMKIGFYDDECAAPLPIRVQTQLPQPQAQQMYYFQNRYEALALQKL